MPKHENGVTYYTRGTARVPVSFPNGRVCCRNCKFCWGEDRGTLKRAKCRLLDDAVIPSEDLDCILPDCPIEFEGAE